MVSIPRDRWDDLRIRLARAEAEAAERALALADARLALRALTAGPSAAPPAALPAPQDVAASVPVAPVSTAPVARADSDGTGVPIQPAVQPGERPIDEIASARSQAARTGGYVPAAGAQPARKRRWWQSK